MSSPELVWLVLGLASVAAIVATGLAMGKRAVAVTRAVSRLMDEVTPVVDELSAEADRASDHAQRLSEGAPSIGRG